MLISVCTFQTELLTRYGPIRISDWKRVSQNFWLDRVDPRIVEAPQKTNLRPSASTDTAYAQESLKVRFISELYYLGRKTGDEFYRNKSNKPKPSRKRKKEEKNVFFWKSLKKEGFKFCCLFPKACRTWLSCQKRAFAGIPVFIITKHSQDFFLFYCLRFCF